MSENTVYLEAPDRTQDLLNIKWALRSAGYAIGSTWHEGEAGVSPLPLKDHWDAKGVEQLQGCGSLIVMPGNNAGSAFESAMMAGFALARGLQIVWIGPPLRGMRDFQEVQQFNTAEDFRKQLLQQTPSCRPARLRSQS
jgi:hypothetical protein